MVVFSEAEHGLKIQNSLLRLLLENKPMKIGRQILSWSLGRSLCKSLAKKYSDLLFLSDAPISYSAFSQ